MAREASPEPCWEEPELPEENAELSVLQPYPERFTSLISTDPSFRGLDLPPRGSVITYTLNPPAEQKEPSIFAVLVLEAWFGDDGVWVKVKFLGADQVWGKSAGISTFSRGKKDLHLCFQFGPQCGLLKGMHIREFGYWPPNTFKGAYVEEKKMAEVRKILAEESQPARPEEGEPRSGGDLRSGGSTPERLSALRKRLTASHGVGAGQPQSVSFAPLPKTPPRTALVKPKHEEMVVVSSDSEARGAGNGKGA